LHLYKQSFSLGRSDMTTSRATASHAPRGRIKTRNEHDHAPNGPPSVPYFELSVQGHVTDSSRFPIFEGAAVDERRATNDRVSREKRCVPYCEFSFLGSVRVYPSTARA
jgi:hypothetical protein